MLKVFGTQVVISRGYDGAAAIKFSEKGDAVRFRIGKKVYDPSATDNTRWINLAVKGFGPICERIGQAVWSGDVLFLHSTLRVGQYTYCGCKAKQLVI